MIFTWNRHCASLSAARLLGRRRAMFFFMLIAGRSPGDLPKKLQKRASHGHCWIPLGGLLVLSDASRKPSWGPNVVSWAAPTLRPLRGRACDLSSAFRLLLDASWGILGLLGSIANKNLEMPATSTVRRRVRGKTPTHLAACSRQMIEITSQNSCASDFSFFLFFPSLRFRRLAV